MQSDEPLLVEVRDGGAAWITINRPEQRNALDAEQWDRLAAALARLAGDSAVRCLVITGAKEAFAAGGDLKRLLAELDAPDGPATFRDRIHRCFDGLCSFPRPTIARVNGAAIGGGLELAIACDIRIAVQSAKWGMPAARFGMVMAATDFTRLASIVGIDRARFLAITADVMDGEDAHRIGLAHELVAAADLDSATERWTRRICGMEPEAVAWFRRAALTLEKGDKLASLGAFEEDCLRRPEFRRRVEEFLRK
jgi:enoyl-CoA hydratase/carnithine racemase